MNTSRLDLSPSLSWLTVALPFIAYGMCAWSFSHPWSDSGPYLSVVLMRRYAFLASFLIAGGVLCADLGFKKRRQIWKPLAGLALTGLFYALAARFEHVF